MWRWILVIVAVALGAAAQPAHAATTLGQAVLVRCDQGVATFEGRVTPLRRAVRTQLRFTLQARTPDDPEWTRVPAPGFRTWITAPRAGRYLYDKTVEQLLAPGEYRALVEFRWRDARGRTVRGDRAYTRVCRQPDPRPDLAIASLNVGDRYVAVVSNDGRGAAGPFKVAFTRNGEPLGSVDVQGLAAGGHTTASLSAPACTAGELIAAQADSLDTVDEADEDGNVLSVTC
ncbi:CARDB domain-containing protein [Candidatus Solirubrobacter pratensis]|uniref:CARDB domain-containing protein n=1 Tax=Candidatus Solirubrobacter pratensis TaxID=1298857 RepID=UPI00041E6BCA|nr:CARDB domain-containing protein [Candidatus Solirubrobacter pratensis]